MPAPLGFDANGPILAPTGTPWADPLDRREWTVRPIAHRDARAFISEHHYARGAANTSVARFGLYHQGGSELLGAVLFMPPPGQAGRTLNPAAPDRVLSLSRLALAPSCPKNAASFLISQSARSLPDRYDLIATWADTGRGHVGTIYQAANWRYRGATRPAPVFCDADGMMVSKKRGPRTFTVAEMRAMGCTIVGRFVRHKYVLDRRDLLARPDRAYPKRAARLFPPAAPQWAGA